MIEKEYLLQTKLFIDNDKLDKYVNLVNIEDSQSFYTERHHIIPRSYFRLKKQKIDNSAKNIVKLSYFNHILAHYYLSLCTIGKLHQANVKAFVFLIDNGLEILTNSELIAINKIAEFASLKEEAKNLQRSQCKEIGSMVKTTEHKAALSKARDLHSTTKGKKAIYNKELNKVKFINEDELEQYIAAGWTIGGKPLTAEAKAKIGLGNSQALKGKTHQARKENKLNSGLTFYKVECIETGQIFENIIEAKKWLFETVGIEGGQIKNCCAGQRETTGGYHWRYIKDEEEEK